MNLANKTIIVTGARSGMGRELAFLLLKKEAKVIGVDINPTSLEQTQQIAQANDQQFKGLVLDISDKTKVESFAKELIAHMW